MIKAKFIVAGGTLLCLGLLSRDFFVNAQAEEGYFEYNNDKEYKSYEVEVMSKGKIHYYGYNSQLCNSPVLIPGTALLPSGLMAVFYCLTLIYLFLGISIVSEIFMDGIEKITSKTQIIQIKDAHGNVEKTKKVKVWNPTIANLSLMALGSSAPEILLSVIETVGNLGGCPGELGASTIVGSASFNLLVISAVSIYAVNEDNDVDPDRDDTVPLGVKKINDMGVFTVTAGFSVLAYILMWVFLMDQKVELYEAVIAFVLFFVLIGLAFGADKYRETVNKKNEVDVEKDAPVIRFTALQIYQELINDINNAQPKDAVEKDKIAEMKLFIQETFKTDNIEKVNYEELKKVIDGDPLINRIKYRKQVGNFVNGRKKTIEKGEILKLEHVHAEQLEDVDKNELFGFECLHYSVSEASGSLKIKILNKTGKAGSVRALTIDDAAKAGDDYEKVDKNIDFKDGQKFDYIEVTINDDDNWEPDEDFFVQLYVTETDEVLSGKDTRTRVTIIDDDKPGQICFQEAKTIKVLATDKEAEIVIIRKNGVDGKVTVDYETMQLGETEHTATPGKDYVSVKDTLTFDQNQTEKTIKVPILPRDDLETRDESFGIQLSNITPDGAKLSKKSFQLVNIVTDIEGKKKAEALTQMLKKIEEEEEITWTGQFIQACSLSPQKNDEGEIEDISFEEGLMHFMTIGWKLVFSIIPPPHYCGGWACFVVSLCMIGAVTYIVGEIAGLFGCVLNIPPAITAITFVALGTSLPDTFASMVAASQEKYADSAIGNVTGSNSVNVFLGLGLPWVIATAWERNTPKEVKGYESTTYYVPAATLGFSVLVFVICAIIAIIILLIRRKVVGGELGGGKTSRTISMVALVSLWLLYIIMSIFQSINLGGIGDQGWGIDLSVKSPNPKCNRT